MSDATATTTTMSGLFSVDGLPPPVPPRGSNFDERGGWVVNALMRDLGIKIIHAGGIVGCCGAESGLEAIQEDAPTSGRGGFGWNQWTGPRRVNFENWCAAHSLETDDDLANYNFLIEELRTSEAHAFKNLQETTTLEAATYTFEALFERPGDLQSTYDRAIGFARRAVAHAVGVATPEPTKAIRPSSAVSSDADNSADDLNRQELNEITGSQQGNASLVPNAVGAGAPASDSVTSSLTTTQTGPTPPPTKMAPGVAIGAGGIAITTIAGTLQFLWPLLHGQMPEAPNDLQAANLAGSLVGLGGMSQHMIQSWRSRRQKN